MQNNILNCLQAYRRNSHYVTNVSSLTHLQKKNFTDLLKLVIHISLIGRVVTVKNFVVLALI